jgi:hypothetical protein
MTKTRLTKTDLLSCCLQAGLPKVMPEICPNLDAEKYSNCRGGLLEHELPHLRDVGIDRRPMGLRAVPAVGDQLLLRDRDVREPVGHQQRREVQRGHLRPGRGELDLSGQQPMPREHAQQISGLSVNKSSTTTTANSSSNKATTNIHLNHRTD